MFKIVSWFEKTVTVILIFLMMITILIGTADLCVNMYRQVVNPPYLLIEVERLLNIFGLFFMILIGLELLETIKTYVTREQVHVEIVFLVAMIAIARKVILLDIKKMDPMMLVGIGIIIISLSAGYYLVKKSHIELPRKKK